MTSTNAARAKEVLYDSETVLRLVDHQLNELREPAESQPTPDFSGFLAVLRQANEEIANVLGTLRHSRTALQGVTIDRLHDSAAKIQEVSSATEVAATDIMNGLDRAQLLVDKLEALDTGSSDAEQAAAIRTELRDELFAMMGPLQFQDITTQQLAHVSTMLTDVEARLQVIASMLGGAKFDGTVVAASVSDQAFAESASTLHASQRQAQADALFAPARPPAP